MIRTPLLGPTVPDGTTLAEARDVLARYKIDAAEEIVRALADPRTKR